MLVPFLLLSLTSSFAPILTNRCLQVFFAITISAMGVSQATGMAPDSNKAKDSAASIFQILDSKPKIDSSSDTGITLSTLVGEIELEHVSFKYPTRPDVQIFRDICLKMPSGKVITTTTLLWLCLSCLLL